MDMGILREAGLTEGESKVYLALLELGPATSGPVVEKSGVSRSIIYNLLEKLAQKGLVSHIVKERTKYFQAADPSRIDEYLEEEGKKYEESRKRVAGLLPKLYELHKSAKGSEATLYMGFRGMMTAHEHSYQKLEKGEEYFYMGIPHDQPQQAHGFYIRDHRRRAKAGIKCRLLFSQKTPRGVLADRNSSPGCEARYMPFGIETPSWVMGYKNVTLIGFSHSNSINVEIMDQGIADSFRAYFEEFWKQSRPFGEESVPEREPKAATGKKRREEEHGEDYSSSEM